MKGVSAACPNQGRNLFHLETGLLSGLLESASISRVRGNRKYGTCMYVYISMIHVCLCSQGSDSDDYGGWGRLRTMVQEVRCLFY